MPDQKRFKVENVFIVFLLFASIVIFCNYSLIIFNTKNIKLNIKIYINYIN